MRRVALRRDRGAALVLALVLLQQRRHDRRRRTSVAQVQAVVGRHRGGDALAIDFVRRGEKTRVVATLQPFAHESLPGTRFDYGHVTLSDGIRLRTIVSRPLNAERPAPALW